MHLIPIPSLYTQLAYLRRCFFTFMWPLDFFFLTLQMTLVAMWMVFDHVDLVLSSFLQILLYTVFLGCWCRKRTPTFICFRSLVLQCFLQSSINELVLLSFSQYHCLTFWSNLWCLIAFSGSSKVQWSVGT